MDLENKQQHNLGLLYFWFFGFLVFGFSASCSLPAGCLE